MPVETRIGSLRSILLTVVSPLCPGRTVDVWVRCSNSGSDVAGGFKPDFYSVCSPCEGNRFTARDLARDLVGPLSEGTRCCVGT